MKLPSIAAKWRVLRIQCFRKDTIKAFKLECEYTAITMSMLQDRGVSTHCQARSELMEAWLKVLSMSVAIPIPAIIRCLRCCRRSSISKLACQLVSSLVESLGHAFEYSAAYFMSEMIKILAISIQV